MMAYQKHNFASGHKLKAAEMNDIEDGIETATKTAGSAHTLSSDYAATIASGTDFNDLISPGEYKVLTSAVAGSCANIPKNTAGRLSVKATTQLARVVQEYQVNSNAAKIYRRYYNGSAWQDWQEVADMTDIAEAVEPLVPRLRILAVGSSFNQDTMAYLPPVLREMMPDVKLTVATCYTSSADLQDHVNWYEADTPYTVYNEWAEGATAWVRYSASTAQTLKQVLARHEWDIIFMQGTSSDVLTDELIQTKIIVPGRKLLRIMQENAAKPFACMWNQWMGRPEGSFTSGEMFQKISEATRTAVKMLGIRDYVPVGAAIQSARTNAALSALGDGGNMLYSDQVHMQAGIPALIAAYTIALKIVQWFGYQHVGVYGSTFIPDAESVSAIKCTGMTHGDPVGVTAGNIRAAQEIATMAVCNPDLVSDCSAVV